MYYHEPASVKLSGSQQHPGTQPRGPPPSTLPPPPPLPKRNSILVPAPGHSLHYGPDGQLRTGSGLESRRSSLTRRLRKGSLPAQLSSLTGQLSSLQLSSLQLSSLPAHLITHELTKSRLLDSPFSENESLILESTQYVREIKQRRDHIHKTLLTHTHPGHTIRRLLAHRFEQKLVRAMSTKKHSSRGGVKRSRRHNTSGWRHWLRRVLRSPRELSRRWRSMAAAGFNEMETDVDDDYGEIETRSRMSTPRLIVDKTGTLCWPPTKIDSQNETTIAKVLNSDNFTFKIPSPDSSSPSVLGWLQVKPDSHIFTPAVEEPSSPFRKVPFHPHLHVLKTKV